MAGASGTNDAVTADELDFRWYGGTTSVCFTATVGERWRRSIERLRTPDDLARWFQQAGMARREPEVSAAQLGKARLLREALYRAFTAHRLGAPTDDADIDLVNQWATRPITGPRLAFADGRPYKTPTTRDTLGLLTTIASDAVELLCGPLSGRIRECGAEDCALLFVDESRSGQRRWCSMDTCGARSKMTAYRKRLRDSSFCQPDDY